VITATDSEFPRQAEIARLEYPHDNEVDFMKGVVVYSSVYGNTKQVAEAIAGQMRTDGLEVELIGVDDGAPGGVAGDFMFVGSPTRMGRPTKEAKRFLEGLDKEAWKNKPIVVFDTVGPLPKDEEKRKKWLSRIEDSAASRMQKMANERGLTTHPEVLHVAVTGFKGPLASDGLEIARAFTHEFVAALK